MAVDHSKDRQTICWKLNRNRAVFSSICPTFIFELEAQRKWDPTNVFSPSHLLAYCLCLLLHAGEDNILVPHTTVCLVKKSHNNKRSNSALPIALDSGRKSCIELFIYKQIVCFVQCPGANFWQRDMSMQHVLIYFFGVRPTNLPA